MPPREASTAEPQAGNPGLWKLIVALDVAMLAELGLALYYAGRSEGDFSLTFTALFFAMLIPTVVVFLVAKRRLTR